MSALHQILLDGIRAVFNAEPADAAARSSLSALNDDDALAARYPQAARDLGQSIEAEYTRSCVDAGLASSPGTSTTCNIWPVSDIANCTDEWGDLAGFVPRARLVSLSILKLDTQSRSNSR